MYELHENLFRESAGGAPESSDPKIFTDLPLAIDPPIHFGVKEFCDICQRCANSCPVNAIPTAAPSDAVYNQSNIKGVVKWSVDGEKCFSYWTAQNSDCSICIRVCPYNKDYSKWYTRLGSRLAGTRLRRLMLKLDIGMGWVRSPEMRHLITEYGIIV